MTTGIWSALQAHLWILRHHAKGVRISHRTRVFGGAGVSIGQGSCVHEQATLACSWLEFDDCFSAPPAGTLRLGRRCSVQRNCTLATYGGIITVGDDVSFNPGVIVYGHGGVTIGAATRIAANSVILPANHKFRDAAVRIIDQGLECRGISIGADVWLGAGVIVLDGVRIGNGAVAAAGAVINRDVGDNCVVGGVPAAVIGHRSNGRASGGIVRQCSELSHTA